MSLFVQSEQLPSNSPLKQRGAACDVPTAMVNSSIWLPERCLGEARKAIVLPSGDQLGERQARELSVKHVNSPAFPSSSVSTYRSDPGRSQRSSVRLEVNATHVPSGDQAGS